MAEELRKLAACSTCWALKRGCLDRDPITLQCQGCKSYIKDAKLQDGGTLLADTFFDAVAHSELYRQVSASSLPTLDISQGTRNQNIFGLQVASSAGNTSDPSGHVIDAHFNTRNRLLVEWLDEFVRRNCCLDIHGKGDHTQIVEDAVLIGGYITLLSSSIRVKEHVDTTRDGVIVENELEHYNLYLHLQHLLLSRLQMLIKEILNSLRFEDPHNEYPGYARTAHAAAVILWYDVDYFRRSLRHGPLLLQNSMPASWKGPGGTIVKWFENIGAELQSQLRRGCGQHVDWDSALTSKRSARRTHTTFKLKLTLHQIKHTIQYVPPIRTIFTPLGDGDVFLISPPRSPTLQVLGLRSHALDVEEEIPAHVSYLALLDQPSTEAETSDMDLNLLPDLKTLIR
ncbi:uncharacterized protein LY89DRAFT_669600 [Mollisia scopiformis]|uniref:Uncharacterized protein n=1 Tax=Mollisia scopiformis TaxID=149040 RepID=A0A194XAJ4_MOLSC|nr:uncharacterized protein LY89DRAFT_669600 [Mollisia scopiformis]KUJ17190.1 hypothetical protein LY89DRAFT_669600 [Mollisia scopiformis]